MESHETSKKSISKLNSFTSPKTLKERQSVSSPFKLKKVEDPGTSKSIREIFNETREDYDKMQNFKFYFVDNNYEKVLKKLKRKLSPLKKSKRSQQKIAVERANSARSSKFGLKKLGKSNFN